MRHVVPLCAFTVGLVAAFLGCESQPAANAVDGGSADSVAAVDPRPDAGSAIDTECTPKVPADAAVPAPYAGRRSPLPLTSNVVLAGRTRFSQRCALCHGDTGRGDGREGPFVPPAADLTALLRNEDHLFWRISEGGSIEPFCTAMPAFRALYTEQARWELVAYVRALAGAGDASTDAAAGDASD